jgi:hypothetical protein
MDESVAPFFFQPVLRGPNDERCHFFLKKASSPESARLSWVQGHEPVASELPSRFVWSHEFVGFCRPAFLLGEGLTVPSTAFVTAKVPSGRSVALPPEPA